MPKRIAFHHFGCKVNFSEASTISREFREHGYVVTGHREEADIYVISTCAVTREAEKKCIYAIRQAHRQNPDARIAVIGCFSELSPEEIQRIDGVSLVLGQSEKFRLLELIEEDLPYHTLNPSTHTPRPSSFVPRPSSLVPRPSSFVPSYSIGDRTRSFLKIQDGCDYFCTYCTIPLARGRSRSDSIAHVVEEARQITAAGIREIVLTGVNIGDFGRQNGESFLQLVETLDSEEGLPRIRISSIEPDLLEDGIIERVAVSKHLMPHFHIPLQSGSDRILKAMHRKYDLALYAERIEKIRSLMPFACIAADVIVGFPGETDEDFQETVRFLGKLDISYMHVFSYSKRDRTKAAQLEGHVPGNIIKARSEQLHQLSEVKKRHFYELNRGRNETVLLESDNVNGFMHGFTRNYIKVKTTFNEMKANTIVDVTLKELEEDMSYSVK
jgi:threonylcarbamoyladenosine tRNA methylthiotransferase MtaB